MFDQLVQLFFVLILGGWFLWRQMNKPGPPEPTKTILREKDHQTTITETSSIDRTPQKIEEKVVEEKVVVAPLELFAEVKLEKKPVQEVPNMKIEDSKVIEKEIVKKEEVPVIVEPRTVVLQQKVEELPVEKKVDLSVLKIARQKKIEVEMREQTENIMGERSTSRSTQILEPEIKNKRSSMQAKKRGSTRDISNLLNDLVSTNTLDAPDKSMFNEIEDTIKREEFQNRIRNAKDSTMKQYGNSGSQETPILTNVQKTSQSSVPPPMPTSSQLEGAPTKSTSSTGKINSNDLMSMLGSLKKTKK